MVWVSVAELVLLLQEVTLDGDVVQVMLVVGDNVSGGGRRGGGGGCGDGGIWRLLLDNGHRGIAKVLDLQRLSDLVLDGVQHRLGQQVVLDYGSALVRYPLLRYGHVRILHGEEAVQVVAVGLCLLEEEGRAHCLEFALDYAKPPEELTVSLLVIV